ncbi:uncharacterized protein PGTG_18605 [Puccinia graminis f. sp. tritici CRL 75-36-700-3]|uniref:Uncharacterized protein n=1 Tax=Puccinia graminis f. sp. tritici (strain CRL 75-36-700-3 / race SCCL) TaxID=418459 RepID=E3L7T1_PUCGT|nr:uncharacterized protein PGTG_18605 [Puccinia graminis f. sp. tritici CRL 75-36-700-3]EFP92606.2 hypothetical protein PGTG_18605 [Puccinia graminis f. sp. tritici CRL 75-36-700-3]
MESCLVKRNICQSIVMGYHLDDVPNQQNAASNAETINSSSDSKTIGVDEEFFGKKLSYMLRTCTNLTKLEIRFEPTSLDEFGNFIIDPLRPMTMIAPSIISQLSNLTHIKIDNRDLYTRRFTEESLVKLIEKMVHLVHIRVDYIEASFPTCDFCKCPQSIQPTVSPLGAHLASLPSLKVILLSLADCFNSGWSKLHWKGSLEELTLHRYSEVSLRALHAFFSLLENSLVKLSLYFGPMIRSALPSLLRLRRTRISAKITISSAKAAEAIYMQLFFGRISQIIPRLCEDMEIVDPDAAPEEILDLIAHGAKAGVKVEYGFVAKAEAGCWLNDGEDEWRFEEEIREREKRLWNTAL